MNTEVNNSQEPDSNENEEESIYETNTATQNRNSFLTDLTNFNYNYSGPDKKLCFVGNDSEFIPSEIIYEFGLKTLILDISFNYMSDLRDLEQFPNLEELICDNNNISENTNFPHLENLKILSCNKNQIEDIHTFIDKVKSLFPNLTYLSLLGNKACPNQLIDLNKDEFDYSRYRKYVIFRLKNLKFLDCYEVTKTEREIVDRDSMFYEVVKAEDTIEINEEENLKNGYTPLPEKNIEETPHGTFGYSKYVYYGKQSEGNRFIRNDDL
ncbi:unnamed protein product [Brachionus calyciflorus]|uniref:Leucine-rich repeat-containing protein n=1 Tax=Brachionus calyciflorus TaxID=104777 RepID=A0A813VLG6_9BILA|nr:unnamed protein product [Brachionus calyciflorus]